MTTTTTARDDLIDRWGDWLGYEFNVPQGAIRLMLDGTPSDVLIRYLEETGVLVVGEVYFDGKTVGAYRKAEA